MTLDPDTESFKELYKEKSERETYTHGIIWKAESFFTALVSGLITVAFSIAHDSGLYSAYGIFSFAIVITFLGHYVLIKESEYFHRYRYERLKIFEKLGYNKFSIVKDFPEVKNICKTWEEYRKDIVERKSGTRYAFRLVFLFQAGACLLGYWVSLLSNAWKDVLLTQNTASLRLVDWASMFLIVVLTVTVVLGYSWEIGSIFDNISKKLDP